MRRNALIDRPDREGRARRIAGLLFLSTCGSVFGVRWLRWEVGEVWEPHTLWNAWWFTATLMAILLAHELGHYGVARYHGFRLSLPWFLPAPILVGTLGAVIRLEEPPRTRAGLLEMGAAGPLAGAAVVVAMMAVRLVWGPLGEGGVVLNVPLVWHGLSLALTGTTATMDTADPIAFATWLGCLLTAMNLLPLGQLDGGHVVAAVFPAGAGRVGWAVTAALLCAGLWWPGWAVWAAVVHLLGARHPLEPRRREPSLPLRARVVALLTVVVFLSTVVPVPL